MGRHHHPERVENAPTEGCLSCAAQVRGCRLFLWQQAGRVSWRHAPCAGTAGTLNPPLRLCSAAIACQRRARSKAAREAFLRTRRAGTLGTAQLGPRRVSAHASARLSCSPGTCCPSPCPPEALATRSGSPAPGQHTAPGGGAPEGPRRLRSSATKKRHPEKGRFRLFLRHPDSFPGVFQNTGSVTFGSCRSE